MTPEVTTVTEDMTVAAGHRAPPRRGRREREHLLHLRGRRGPAPRGRHLAARPRACPSPTRSVAEIVERDVITVGADDDQEDVAETMSKYDLLALPVVDETGKLLGIVTVDDALDVMEEESAEDLALATGSRAQVGEHGRVELARPQDGWLVVWVVLGVGAALVLRAFSGMRSPRSSSARAVHAARAAPRRGRLARTRSRVLIEAGRPRSGPRFGRAARDRRRASGSVSGIVSGLRRVRAARGDAASRSPSAAVAVPRRRWSRSLLMVACGSAIAAVARRAHARRRGLARVPALEHRRALAARRALAVYLGARHRAAATGIAARRGEASAVTPTTDTKRAAAVLRAPGRHRPGHHRRVGRQRLRRHLHVLGRRRELRLHDAVDDARDDAVASSIVQEMAGRMGAVTGKGFAALIRERFGVRPTFLAMLMLLASNAATTVAEFAGIAAAMELFGVSQVRLGADRGGRRVAARGARQLPQRREGAARALRRCSSPTSSRRSSRSPTGREVARRVRRAARSCPTAAFIALAIGLTGTTIAPWMQFLVQSNIVDKGTTVKEWALARWDVIARRASSANVVACFIIITTGNGAPSRGHRRSPAPRRPRGRSRRSPATTPSCCSRSACSRRRCSRPRSCRSRRATRSARRSAGSRGVDRSWSEAPLFNGLYTFVIVVGAAVILIPGSTSSRSCSSPRWSTA